MKQYLLLLPFCLAVPFIEQTIFQDKECPPEGLDSVQNLNLSRYIEEPWYVQYQEPTSYQQADNLYCVRAKYAFNRYSTQNFIVDALLKFFRWFRYGPGVETLSVMNYANEDQVNGKVRNGEQKGILLNPRESSKLLVGPGSFLVPRWFFGPYYVMWVNDDYQSAIVSGGLPEVLNQTTGCCQTLSNQQPFNPITNNGNKQGLWFFTRAKLAQEREINVMFQAAHRMGYETGRMVKVPQQGCIYQV